MSKLTAKEIIQKVKDSGIELTDFAYDGAETAIAGINNLVYSKGGEDEGSDWRRVYYFIEHNVYLEISGFYQSDSGVDLYNGWDSIEEVFPKEKSIIVYE